MKQVLNTYSLQWCIAVILLLVSFQARSQALSFSISPVNCYVPNGNNTTTLLVASTPPTAVSYSWSITGSCLTTPSPAVSNGSIAYASYLCCGQFTVNCIAFNASSTIVGTASTAVVVNCSPTITVATSNTANCAGTTVTLSASGAQSYTWSTGFTGGLAMVSPTSNVTYTVAGTNASGCQSMSTVSLSIISQAFANFTYTLGPNGLVTFSNTSFSSGGANTYTWNFGNGLTSNQVSPSTTYTGNGSYTVSLTAFSGCGGPSVAVYTLMISSVTGPSCTAAFTYTQNGSGGYTFFSTSSGTSTLTTYSWNFSNGTTYTAVGNAGVSPPTQTFTNGSYTVSLSISSSTPILCASTYTLPLYVVGCNLNTSFSSTQTGSTTMNFYSTSTFTSSNTTFLWNYGDNSTGFGLTSSHTYSAPGQYTVTLTANNNFSATCVKTQSQVITLAGCNLLSNFTHTLLSNGTVSFSSASAITSSITSYTWDFGDGIYSFASSPSHVYGNAGTYYVSLILTDSTGYSCRDSLTQSINVTGIPCFANSGFTVTPTGTPHYWNAVPYYPWNVTSATWSWGDGTQSNSLYTSHLYSVAATYSICLSVTVSCGASSSYCFPYLINRSGDGSTQVVNINVLPPEKGNGVQSVSPTALFYTVFPNPNTGLFTLGYDESSVPDRVSVSDLSGREIYTTSFTDNSGTQQVQIDLSAAANGIYFMKVSRENRLFVQKIVIAR